jgi:hypothetical protein
MIEPPSDGQRNVWNYRSPIPTLESLLDRFGPTLRDSASQRGRRVFRVLAVVVAWIAGIATAAAFGEEESVLLTTPLVSAVGLTMLIIGVRTKHPFTWVAWVHTLLAPSFYALILLGTIKGPSDIAVIAPVIGVLYTAFAISTAVLIWNVKDPNNGWACASCGYLLVGLTSDRCPECGGHFVIDGVIQSCRAELDDDLTLPCPYDLVWCRHCEQHVPVFHAQNRHQEETLATWQSYPPEPYVLSLATGVTYAQAVRWRDHRQTPVKPIAPRAEGASSEAIV